MKPTVAADEMFPEGVGPYMDLEEDQSTATSSSTGQSITIQNTTILLMKENSRNRERQKFNAGGPSNLLMDLAANEKAVHADFFNDFEDLFDDEDVK